MQREIEAQAQAAAYMDLAVRNLRVLSRAVIRGIELGEAVPAGIGVALQQLARAAAGLGAELAGDTQHADRDDHCSSPLPRPPLPCGKTAACR